MEYENHQKLKFLLSLLKGAILSRMNYRGEAPKLELKLNLSPPRDHRRRRRHRDLSPPESVSSSVEVTSRGSCVSRETSPGGSMSSPESGSSMMLVGCPRCLMYVMLREDDPKCLKCKSTVLLDFLHEDRNKELNK